MDKNLQDKFDQAKAAATDSAQKAADSLRHGVERAGERARAIGSDANARLDKAKTQASKAAGEANRIITEHPFAVAAAAIAVGALVAHFLPKGRKANGKAGGKAIAKSVKGIAAAQGSAVASALLSSITSKANTAKEKLTAGETLPSATVKAPLEQAEQFLGKIGDAARHIPASAKEKARAGVENAKSGLEQARTFASETVKRADIEERAGKLLDIAGVAVTQLAGKLHERAGKRLKDATPPTGEKG